MYQQSRVNIQFKSVYTMESGFVRTIEASRRVPLRKSTFLDQRADYGSTSTQRKGVYGPITSLRTLLVSPARALRNHPSRRRSGEGRDWSAHSNLPQNQDRFTTAPKRLPGPDLEP